MSFKTKKSLGQNFLVNPHILDKIISAAEISKGDTIVEIGPGTGLLTKKLAEKAGRVIGVEKDQRLIPVLAENLKNYPNTEIIEADALEFNPKDLKLGSGYKIVANIPYYITSNFIRKVSESPDWHISDLKLMVLTIQKEVAQRIMALPAQAGKPPHMNLLALSVQYYYEPEIIGYISKNNFRPVPKIDSAIIKLVPKPATHDTEYAQKLFDLIHIGFSEKRKQLIPLLVKGLKIDKEEIIKSFKQVGLNPTVRAENLSLQQWQMIISYLV